MTSPSEQTIDLTATRVVLVDGRADRRSVMRHMFENSDVAATVVGEADSQAEAMALVGTCDADVVVVDLPSPVEHGLETVAALRGRFPQLGIVVCTFNREATVKEQALAQGADAYLLKPVTAREVMAASPRQAIQADPMPATANA